MNSPSNMGRRESIPPQRGVGPATARNQRAWRPAPRDTVTVLLRRAVPGDEDAVARVHVRSWQVAYRGLLPDEYLDRLEPADRAARYTFAEDGPGFPHTTVAVGDDGICGFTTTGPCRDPDKKGVGELYAIYVQPDWWDRGIGRTLIADVRRRFAEQRFSEAVLWVLRGNQRAERFYRIDGWEPDGHRRLQDLHGITIDEVRYTRSPIRS